MAVKDPGSARCRHCNAPVGATARFCPSCGLPLERDQSLADEVVVPNSGRLRISSDMVSLSALHQFVQECVCWWQQRLQGGEVSREEASRTIEELRRALLSLSYQIASGRQTLRVTTSLPSTRRFPVGCPRCGRGNRRGALFCYACGWALSASAPARQTPGHLRVRTGLRVDQGRVRPTNQDAALIEDLQLPDGRRALCCIVADGMGGAQAGAQASSMACSTIHAGLRHRVSSPPAGDDGWRRMLRDVVVEANHAIYTHSRSDSSLHGMGTTVVVALIVDSQAHLASVGDSRIYLANQRGIADNGITWALLTVDHTLVARLVDLGIITAEQARTHPRRNVLYRVLGVEPSVEVDTDTQPLQVGDRLLLCSDGLTGSIDNEELTATLMQTRFPQEAADRLVALANERGGRDNITALVLSFDEA